MYHNKCCFSTKIVELPQKDVQEVHSYTASTNMLIAVEELIVVYAIDYSKTPPTYILPSPDQTHRHKNPERYGNILPADYSTRLIPYPTNYSPHAPQTKSHSPLSAQDRRPKPLFPQSCQTSGGSNY